MYEFCVHDTCLLQYTYWIARGGIIICLARTEITFISCNPNAVAPQDRADHSSRLHLIVGLGNYFMAYDVKATAYILITRIRTIC